MSFKVELHIANKVFKVLNYNTDYHQGTDQTNRPIVKPQGGIHNFTIEDDGSILIFDLMVKNNYTVDAVLIVFSRDGTRKVPLIY